MKKILGLIGSFGLIATTGIAVVSCGNNDANKKDEKDLSNFIKQINLPGTGKDAVVYPTAADVLQKINSVNNLNLAKSDVTIEIDKSMTGNKDDGYIASANVIAKDTTKYSGSIKVYFSEPQIRTAIVEYFKDDLVKDDKGDLTLNAKVDSEDNKGILNALKKVAKELKPPHEPTKLDFESIEIDGNIDTNGKIALVHAKQNSTFFYAGFAVKYTVN